MDRQEYKKQYMHNYNRSDRGKAAQNRYNTSEKGKQTRSRYGQWYRRRDEDKINYLPVIAVILLITVVGFLMLGCSHGREVHHNTHVKGYAIDLSKPVTVTVSSHDD